MTSVKCCYCGRTAKEIIGSIEVEGQVTPTSLIEVMFVDTTNHLACGRCISEHDIGIGYGGKAVYEYKTYDKRSIVNKPAIDKAIKESVDLFEDARPAFFH